MDDGTKDAVLDGMALAFVLKSQQIADMPALQAAPSSAAPPSKPRSGSRV